MNKTELINAISERSGLNKADSKKALDAFIDAVSTELKQGGKVSLVGFGTYSILEKSARKGINPRTQKSIDIPAKKVVKFKAGSELSDL